MALGESFQFEIGADIRAARAELDALKSRIAELKGDVDQVDGARVDIDVDSRQVDDVRESVEDLRQTAERGIDLNIDADRSAARTATDVESIRRRGEGLQSAIPALRGFGDELGGTARAAGVAGQAVGDLGDFSLILGEKFGLSETATTSLGTALGAAGLAAVIAGVAVPALQSLISQQDELSAQTQGAIDALSEQADVLGKFEQFVTGLGTSKGAIVTAVLGDEGDEVLRDAARDLGRLGLTVEDLPKIFGGSTGSVSDFYRSILLAKGATDEQAQAFADLAANGGIVSANLDGVPEALRPVIQSMIDLRELSSDVDLEAAFEGVIRELVGLGEVGPDVLAQIEDGTITAQEAFTRYAETAREATDEVVDSLDNIPPAVQSMSDRALAAFSTFVDEVNRLWAGALTEANAPLDELRQQLENEKTFERLADQLDKVKAAPGDREETRRLLDLVLGLGEAYDEIPRQKIVEIFTQIDEGQVFEAFNEIQRLANERGIRLPVTQGGTVARIDPGAAPTIAGATNITNVYTIGVDPVPATRDYVFANGAR